MEFFRCKTLIFKEFFRGEQRFHGIFREKSTFSRISSGVDPFLREVFRGECSLVEFFRGKKKSYSSTGGVRILNAIAHCLIAFVVAQNNSPMDIYKFLRFVENVKNFRKLRDVETFGAFDFLKIVLSSMQATIQL